MCVFQCIFIGHLVSEIISFDCIEFKKLPIRVTLMIKITFHWSRFHAYAVIMEMDCYEGEPLDPKTNRANIVLKKKTFGGVPPGSGMREDVILLFEELEEAKNSVAEIQAIIEEVPEPKLVVGKFSDIFCKLLKVN